VFGLSFGEVILLGVIALVVVGPRNLPTLLRSAGQLIGRLRRMAMDLRTESGIDEILDTEGIRHEIDNFRRLASGQISPDDFSPNVVPDREREYPRAGPDAYGAFSEDLVPYLPAQIPALAAAEASAAASPVAAAQIASPAASPDASPSPVPTAPPRPSLSSGSPPATSPSTNGAGVKR